MIKNHIKLAFRSFWNRKLSTAINIFGLSLGIACASMAFVFIHHERSFDRFHDEAEKIHFFYTNVNERFNIANSPGPFGPSLTNDFPEVTEAIRLKEQTIFVQSGMEIFKEEALFVDPNFFSFFSFPLLKGDEKTALTETNAIVLSESMAQKYFGRKDPVGATLSIIFNDQENVFKVTGLAKDSPSNSSIQFQFLLPLSLSYKENIAELESNWSSFSVGTLIRFREMEDIASFSEKLPNYVNGKLGLGKEADEQQYTFHMRALNDYHLNNDMSISGLVSPGQPGYVKILSIIALLILFVACLNFMNLSNAQSSQRLKEVGVRRVLGAGPRQLMMQFLSESVLISLLSLVIAILFLLFFLPFSKSLFDYPLTFDWKNPGILLTLLSIAIITGVLAGSYPSFLLSKIKAANTFKSTFKIGGNNWATKMSLIFQFALSIGLLACTGIMYQQQRFISQHNLGFNQEEVVVIPTQITYDDNADNGLFVERYRSALRPYDGVIQVAGVSNSFNRGNRAQFVTDHHGSQQLIFEYTVDPQYIDLLKIELLEGRNFSNDIQEDQKRAIIINEAFQKEYQVEDINNYQFPASFGEAFTGKKIIAVVKDYHYSDLKTAVKPMYLMMDHKAPFEHMLVKIKPAEVQSTLVQLKTAWQNIRSDKPFEFYFLNEDLQKQYTSETRWSKILSGASLLAILIAMLGLFGLLALVLAQRSKEIGIRKILGARVANILILLSKDFLMLIGIALLVASPAAWYFMNKWLENFAFHIDIKWWMFLMAGLILVITAFITISFQSIQAALANPVKSLKSE